MKHTNRTLGRVDASRCSVCSHPDREDPDPALVLKRKTQADVARIVGVDRSPVSRHVKNHVMPTLAQGVVMETKDVAIGSIVEAFDRTYEQTQVLYERAMNSGDLSLAATMLDQQRRILEIVARYASKMGQATLQDVIGNDQAAERAHMEQIRANLIERLDDLAARNFRGIARPDSSAVDTETADGSEGEAGDQGGSAIEAWIVHRRFEIASMMSFGAMWFRNVSGVESDSPQVRPACSDTNANGASTNQSAAGGRPRSRGRVLGVGWLRLRLDFAGSSRSPSRSSWRPDAAAERN